MSTYVIGDLQGCFNELQELLGLIDFDYQKDALWLVGDLVCRGQDSLKTLEFLVDFPGELHCVLGNHDLNLLAVAHGVRKVNPHDHVDELLHSEKWPQYEAWLRHTPLLHYDAKLNTVMTHAGIYPLWSLDQAKQYAHEVEQILRSDQYIHLLTQMYGDIPLHWREDLIDYERYRFIINAFTRMRALTPDGELNLNFKGRLADLPPNLKPWFKFSNPALNDTRIVFGHWAALEGKTHMPGIEALDTGCAWGNALTALRLEDNQRFCVKCNVVC